MFAQIVFSMVYWGGWLFGAGFFPLILFAHPNIIAQEMNPCLRITFRGRFANRELHRNSTASCAIQARICRETKIANRSYQTICANCVNAMKIVLFWELIRANRPNSRCESLSHLSKGLACSIVQDVNTSVSCKAKWWCCIG